MEVSDTYCPMCGDSLDNSVTVQVYRVSVNGRKGAWMPGHQKAYGQRVSWEGPRAAHKTCGESELLPL